MGGHQAAGRVACEVGSATYSWPRTINANSSAAAITNSPVVLSLFLVERASVPHSLVGSGPAPLWWTSWSVLESVSTHESIGFPSAANSAAHGARCAPRQPWPSSQRSTDSTTDQFGSVLTRAGLRYFPPLDSLHRSPRPHCDRPRVAGPPSIGRLTRRDVRSLPLARRRRAAPCNGLPARWAPPALERAISGQHPVLQCPRNPVTPPPTRPRPGTLIQRPRVRAGSPSRPVRCR